ncbi:hypothetical protein B046DRAFT_05253 [Streptomyces sp. LamerLS-316]|uniref:hypothetical protein n=1 Tax=Streptomyces sp. NPDC102415 TaxID=3366173 RepID=UPI0008239E6B|nr:hypothetical protein B046DRAFT_05253 [Streptomyces sp. LamerLS-316]
MAVDLSFYTSPLSEEIRDEGRVESRAEDVLLILNGRGIEITDTTRDKVTTCDDPEVLRRWLVRAAVVTTSDEIFGDAARADR